MCDKIGMFAEHIVSDNHRKTLQRVLNEGPTVRALTAEIRQDSGSKAVLARVDLIGNYVVPERNVVKMEEVAVRESELVVSHPQGRSSSMEVDSPRCGIPSDVRKSKVEPPIVDTEADEDDDDEDDDDDVSIMSLN
ncbi:hypothetical protein Pmar_PMAR006744 [Perkinsus marinus ATCC 50983]|uniref:Uncharacterized protein n=1 Tax=Perkinsus marinus (strain ATCC 50983 / TXsc) TaxID=423536 RepID=C5K6D2_PERM5|nr:hypothetical protein Pmar_PMAR006744 [Perkinsus marinus ATCC 50983]EER19852.1 hypothetical protein Pmar_PMAR006744 [Perkinsus marinus ATCC 50983]|eukprot:XP_002788056.1 hypothetical protein Pmar_PMAR006744 [Perkinsus marinus ATCC 50983]